jgi:hypothetical protein
MKTKLLLPGIMLVFLSLTTKAQVIQSLTVLPVNPTPTDTITILAECMFPSGGCELFVLNVGTTGQDIYASALHCLGPLTVICNYTDTIILNPLPAGAYTFHFQLDAGFGPEPCTPGIVPGPTDTITFVVSPTVDVPEVLGQDEIAVFPNPFQEQFHVTGIEPEHYPVTVDIFSAEGKLVKSIRINEPSTTISVKELPAAIYQLQLTNANGVRTIVPAVKN